MKPVHGPRRIAVPAMLAGMIALAGPALAQSESDRFPEGLDELPGRIEEAMRGLIDSMKPAFEDVSELMDVLGRIDSPTNYEKPVILPNGDILIRRSPDAPDWDPEVEDLEDGPLERHLDPDEGTPI